jgi:tetratricopeptide (TPR) repeat protein
MFAVLLVILPWLRTIPSMSTLPALPWQAGLVGVALICAALAMYRWLGNPQLIAQPASTASAMAVIAGASSAGNGAAAAGSMSAAVDSLRARLASGGGGADDWELLAKSYEFMGQPEAARQAREHKIPPKSDNAVNGLSGVASTGEPAAITLTPKSLKLLGNAATLRHDKNYAAAAKVYKQLAAELQMNADAWADYADTLATLQGNKLVGEPEAYIARALAVDARHPKALWLQASADEEAGRYVAAVAVWQKLSQVLPADSQDSKIVTANLQRDKEMVASSGAADDSHNESSGTRISGEVSLSNTLTDRAISGATLFIVAKSVDLPGPPVAVYRGSVRDWPVKFTLDDSSSMLPGRNLTNAKRVTVEARISRSGQALPAAGDLRGVTGIVDVANHEPLKIVISEVVT